MLQCWSLSHVGLAATFFGPACTLDPPFENGRTANIAPAGCAEIHTDFVCVPTVSAAQACAGASAGRLTASVLGNLSAKAQKDIAAEIDFPFQLATGAAFSLPSY